MTENVQICDWKALSRAVDHIVSWSGYSTKTHGQLFELFREALVSGEAEIKRLFEEKAWSAGHIIRARADLIDGLIAELAALTLNTVYPAANPTKGEQIAIVAVGGYGRRELAPHSDIDLLFLLPYKMTPHTEQVVEFMLYFLWDLKLDVGHATRSTNDALRMARDDLTVRTNMLESRYIAGHKALYDSLWQSYINDVVLKTQNAFVEAKLAERDIRHEKTGDTRYVLEPDIKDGKGGLRDLQTLFWIVKYLYQVADIHDLVARDVFTTDDVRLFDKAANFLWTVRCNLHFLAGREEDRLAFDIQQEVARRMGYRDHAGTRGVERLMKHYFLIAKDVGDLTRVLCAVMEEQHKKKTYRFRLPSLPFYKNTRNEFSMETGRLNVAGRKDFQKDPVKLLTLFQTSLEHDIYIHPRALRAVRQCLNLVNGELRENPRANEVFVNILTSRHNPEKILMAMNETGVFGRFIPDFGRIVAQMQYDMYHVYTVDEHTIRAIGILHRIEKGELASDHPTSTDIIKEVQSRRVLYIAVMLHDIAKGRKGDHSEIGADIARRLCPRLGLNEWETETVSWLVLHHLLMSRIAFKRDLDDPQTVRDFANTVQSPERLRLLMILTVADIRAVGPKVWNAWKAALIRDLYYRTQETFSGVLDENKRDQRMEGAKANLRARLADWDPEWVASFLERGRAHYWLSFKPQVLVRHARVVKEAEEKGLDMLVRSTVLAAHDITELVVYARDNPGLFASISGAITLSGASIIDAKIVTMTDGMAMDTFWIQDKSNRAYDEPRRLEILVGRIERAIQGELLPVRELARVRARAMPSRTRVFTVPPRVLCDNTISSSATVIEINGRDRPGLLLDLTTALAETGLHIISAHISTYGERVVDVFYVKDAFGLKITNEKKIKQVRTRLIAILTPETTEDGDREAKVKDTAAQ